MRIDARPIALQPDSRPDAARIDKTARDMEGLFAQMMIKQMRETALGDSLFPGAAGQFRELYDEQIATALTQGQGLGLREMIARQLTRDAGGEVPAAKAVEALPLALAEPGQRPMLPLDTYLRPLAAKPLASADRPATAAAPAWIPAEAVPRLRGLEAPPPASAAAPAAPVAKAEAPISTAQGRIDAFVAKVWPHAQRVARELGVDPRAIVAQAALETGWGRSTIQGEGRTAHNYFGIKATGSWRGDRVATATQEFADGAFRTERAAFRAYDGVEQSFADYAALLQRNPRYAEALNAGDDIRGFAGALQRAGYATDPAYARKIEAIATGPTLGRALARLEIDDATGPAAPAARHTLFAAGAFGGL